MIILSTFQIKDWAIIHETLLHNFKKLRRSIQKAVNFILKITQIPIEYQSNSFQKKLNDHSKAFQITYIGEYFPELYNSPRDF